MSLLASVFAIYAITYVDAFVTPKTFQKVNTFQNPTNLKSWPGILPDVSSIVLSDESEALAQANSALSAVRTFFFVITAIVFAGVGLTYFVASVIVPQAAKQLEQDTKRLRPGLWEQYVAKLGEGETMEQRPDLLQELGNIMQPIIIKDFEDSADAKFKSKDASKNDASKSRVKLKNDDRWKD